MPYTLVKALVWLIIAFALGMAIGWLLRNATTRRQMAKARGDGAEHERLRQRVTELEPLIDERTRLLAELEACRSQRDRLAGTPSAPEPATEPAPESAVHGVAAVGDDPPTSPPAPTEAEAEPAGGDTAALDLAAAAAVLGRSVEGDDLKVIEGVGPKIEELCHGIGIRTWADLADTEVSLLRTMLTDAGARYKVHDPSSWPEQAGLLSEGRWHDFQAFVDRLDGGVDRP
jgi:predicted flap endonuclease-1-like 5' DNA nuclease